MQMKTIREPLAVSAWRKCIFLSEYATRVVDEGRYPDVKATGEKPMKAMTEDCTKVEG